MGRLDRAEVRYRLQEIQYARIKQRLMQRSAVPTMTSRTGTVSSRLRDKRRKKRQNPSNYSSRDNDRESGCLSR